MQWFSKHGSNNFGMADGTEPKTSPNRVVHNQTSATHTVEHGRVGKTLADQQLKGARHYLSSHYLHIKRCLKQRKLHFQRQAALLVILVYLI